MAKNKKPRVLQVKCIEYEMFMTQLYNYIFPPVLHKALSFYIWYFVEKEPTQIFSKDDLLEIIDILNSLNITDLDSLVNEIQSFPIPDAVAVREAIRYKIDILDEVQEKHIIAPSKPFDAIIDCLKTFAKAMP